MSKPLHSLQVKILKLIYKRKMSIYKISKILGKPTPLIQFHVNHLYKMGLLRREENKKNKGYVYKTNHSKVKIEDVKDKTIVYIKVE